MTQLEIWLLAVSLAMDCFTVSVASGIIQRRWNNRTVATMVLAFGLFQGGMTLAGWFFTSHLRGVIEAYDHWVAFLLLSYLGGKMIWDGLKGDEEEAHHFDPTCMKTVLTLAVATSIDALAVGISFACIGMSEWNVVTMPFLIIALVSFLFTWVGYGIGVFFGKRFKFPVEPVGGLVLIVIGCRILCEHIL